MPLPTWRQRKPHPRDSWLDRNFPDASSPVRSSRLPLLPPAPQKPKRSLREINEEEERNQLRRRRLDLSKYQVIEVIYDSDDETDEMIDLTDEKEDVTDYESKYDDEKEEKEISVQVEPRVLERFLTYFQCAICNLESISCVPVQLPCGRHTLCYECAHTSVDRSKEYLGNTYTLRLRCPQCFHNERANDGEAYCDSSLNIISYDTQHLNNMALHHAEMCAAAQVTFHNSIHEFEYLSEGDSHKTNQVYIHTAPCPFQCGEQLADVAHLRQCGSSRFKCHRSGCDALINPSDQESVDTHYRLHHQVVVEEELEEDDEVQEIFVMPREVTGQTRQHAAGMVAIMNSIANNPILHYHNMEDELQFVMQVLYWKFCNLRSTANRMRQMRRNSEDPSHLQYSFNYELERLRTGLNHVGTELLGVIGPMNNMDRDRYLNRLGPYRGSAQQN